MAFTIPVLPPKKVSFSEDTLLPKFFYDEVPKEEERGCVQFESPDKARFKGDTFAIKEFTRNKVVETGKKFLKKAKILESINHPTVVHLKKKSSILLDEK